MKLSSYNSWWEKVMGLMGPNSFEAKNWNRGTRLVYSPFFLNNLKVQQKILLTLHFQGFGLSAN
jgi:hypothetical protein